MRRLFTFGCSFTKYNWPSWADILGQEFDLHENWGHIGLGNRAIAERVAECHARSNIQPDDTVVIQWSGYNRHDWMHTKLREGDISLWRTKGNIFSPPNSQTFNTIWVHKFWDAKAYYIHTLNNILLTQGLLKSTGCNWAMTSLTNLSEIGPVVGLSTSEIDMYNRRIWADHIKHWVLPMNDFRNSGPNVWWEFKPSKREPPRDLINGKFKEGHMTVDQNALFVDYIKDALDLTTVLNTEQQLLIAEVNAIKEKFENYDEFVDAIKATKWGATNLYHGF